MSDVAPVAAVATDADPNKAAHVAVADADRHTPETPHVEPPAPHTPPPTESGDGLAALRGVVETLGTTVATLQETVTKLLPKDAPVSKRVPWTHRGGHTHADTE